MTEAYWTHCMYCGGMICGVEVLDEYPDVVVLYAHKTCYERYSDDRANTAVPGREHVKELIADLPSDAGTGGTAAEL
jgi:hypothetical protein